MEPSLKTWNTPELTLDLLSRHGPGDERGGVVLDDGTVVELMNKSNDAAEGCFLDPDMLIQHEDRMVATWHTHPTTSGTLSGVDWDTFVGWPDHQHAIIGIDGVHWYAVRGRMVVNSGA